MTRPLVLLAFTLLAAPAVHAAAWQADGNTSTLGFIGVSQGAAFDGKFKRFKAAIEFDPAQLASARFDVQIELAAADTANAERDDTLHGKDFFDVARHPTATWTAAKVRSLGGNRYAADGTLSLRGVSKPVRLNFTWTAGAKPTLVGEAMVNRLDFNVGSGQWADTTVIGNAVKVRTSLQLAPAGH